MATGWGNKLWGSSEWGDLSDETVIVSSVAATTAIGTSTTEANANVDVTGLSLSFTFPGVVAGASALIIPTGVSASIVTGNELTGIGVPVTGSSVSTSIGSVTIDDQFLIGEGWGRETWGSLVWGDAYSVQLQGISLSVVTGNEDAFTDVTAAVSGIELQSAVTPVGTSANADHEIAASLLISSAQGDITTEATALVEVTGVSASIQQGGAVGGTIQEVPVTGISANVFVGNEDTSGNANVFPSGVSTTLNIGQASYIAGYDVTGINITTSVGQVTIEAEAVVIPTGVTLTISTISPNIIAWAEVDTGTDVTWTDVDLAA